MVCRVKRKASQERRDEDGGGGLLRWRGGGGGGAGGGEVAGGRGGVLGEAGGRKGRKKGTITSGRLLPQRRQPGRSFRQNMVAARSKATFVLLSGAIEVTSEGGKRGPPPYPAPLHPIPPPPPPATLPSHPLCPASQPSARSSS